MVPEYLYSSRPPGLSDIGIPYQFCALPRPFDCVQCESWESRRLRFEQRRAEILAKQQEAANENQ